MKTIVTLIFILAAPLVFAEDRFANVKIETVPVTGNIYMLVGQGGNIGVSRGSDGLLMIDDQFAPLSDRIKAALAELGDASPQFLLNTHYHGDHTGGNEAFGKDSLIVAHDNVRIRLLSGDTPGSYPSVALPVVTYTKQANIYFNDERIRLVHMPMGHTDGDTVVFFEDSHVVHMGDHFFKDRFPYVDLEAGGTVQGMIANVSQVLDMIDDETALIPGHGSLADKADLERYLEMLIGTRDEAKAAMNAGKSAADLIDAGLHEKWESWGAGFINEERWIQTLYNSLSQDM